MLHLNCRSGDWQKDGSPNRRSDGRQKGGSWSHCSDGLQKIHRRDGSSNRRKGRLRCDGPVIRLMDVNCLPMACYASHHSYMWIRCCANPDLRVNRKMSRDGLRRKKKNGLRCRRRGEKAGHKPWHREGKRRWRLPSSGLQISSSVS